MSKAAEKPSFMKQKALFLDRDGTVNVEKNYVFRIEDVEFREGIFELVKTFADDGFLIFIVTNQSGIARGFYTEEDFYKLTRWMVEQFRQKGITITRVYFCPHHPDFTGECNCRKPNPGMLLQAIEEYNLDPAACVLIGDHETDVRAGKNANIGRNFLIPATGKVKI